MEMSVHKRKIYTNNRLNLKITNINSLKMFEEKKFVCTLSLTVCGLIENTSSKRRHKQFWAINILPKLIIEIRLIQKRKSIN